MIDREARQRAYAALRRFADGETTNDEFEDEYAAASTSADRAIKAIATMAWHLYDDGRVHRLTGKDTPGALVRALLERSLLFLQSDREYLWPVNDFITYGEGGPGWKSILFGRGGQQLAEKYAELECELAEGGAMSSWPFTTPEELAAAQDLNGT